MGGVRKTGDVERTSNPQLAHFMSSWLWRTQYDGHIKGMLLFFDGVALTVPEQTAAELIGTRAGLPLELAEAGLLRTFDPDLWMTDEAAAAIRKSVCDIVDRTPAGRSSTGPRAYWYHEYINTLVIGDDRSMALRHPRFVFTREELEADDSENVRTFLRTLRQEGFFYGWQRDRLRLQGQVADLIIALAAQISRVKIRDFDLHPFAFDGVTRAHDVVLSATSPLARTVELDLNGIGTSLPNVPLDEILDFRRQHGAQYRAYALDVRKAAIELSMASPQQRRDLERLRLDGLRERADELRQLNRASFSSKLAVTLSLIGAGWSAKQGDDIAGIVAGLAGLAGMFAQPPTLDPQAYLWAVRSHFG